MFTGIVQGIAQIQTISGHDIFRRLTVKFPDNSLKEIKKGASVAINGTCLTVTDFNTKEDIASFDVIEETLAKTNLSFLEKGSKVNFERAACIGDEIGGHLMSGHIHATVKVVDIERKTDNTTISFAVPEAYRDYLLPKGFVGLNGCSLTIGSSVSETFCVHLIPETLTVTTFGEMEIDDNVNLEIDPQTLAIVDTVYSVLKKNH